MPSLKFPSIILAVLVYVSILLLGCVHQKTSEELKKEAMIKERLDKYARVELKFDKSSLDEKQSQIVDKLVASAKHIDDIYWRQTYHGALALREKLGKSNRDLDKLYLKFLNVNYSPFDGMNDNENFIADYFRPPGAGFYPEDLTKEQFENHVNSLPEERVDFTKINSVIKWDDGKLVAVPYEVEYETDLKPAAKLLEEASELAENESLKTYLSSRSDALQSGNFYDSDRDWVLLEGNTVDVVIGPIETYDDELTGNKASYECYVMLKDIQESKNLEIYRQNLQAMENNLPVPPKYKKKEVKESTSLGVFTQVYGSGQANAGIKAIAFSLPNDARVVNEVGSRKCILKNVLLAKFNKILMPIARELIADDQLQYVQAEPFFTNVLLHEVAHTHGVDYVVGKANTTIRRALSELYSPIEEAKADVVGLYDTDFLADKGIVSKQNLKTHYVSYLASIFRSIRFGTGDAHGKANMMEFNYLLGKGAFEFDEATGKYRVNFDMMKDGLKQLAAKFLTIEGDGDYDGAKQMLETYSLVTEQTQSSLDKLTNIPVDLDLVYQF